jgi:hypothetical protein
VGDRNIRVINGGIAAYGPQQIRLMFAELADTLRPDLVVVGLFLGDLRRVDDPFTFFHGYALRTSHIARISLDDDGFLHSAFRNSIIKEVDFWLCRHFWLAAHILRMAQNVRISLQSHGSDSVGKVSSSDFEPTLREVKKLATDARNSGIPLVVMMINGQLEDGSFGLGAKPGNDFVRTRLQKEGIRGLDVLPALVEASNGAPRLRNGGDYHWSPAAHAVAAEALAGYIRSERLLR